MNIWEMIWKLAGRNLDEMVRPQYPPANIEALKQRGQLKMYEDWAKQYQRNPNLFDPQNYYDIMGAFKANVTPDLTGHWPSKFKLEGHPNLIIKDIDTRTGRRVGKEK